MRVYKNAWFAKFARKERISDTDLCEAVKRVKDGLIDADLGGGLLKQRVARDGEGKSGGYRTLIFYRQADRAIFAFGFAKNAKANLSADELAQFKKFAKTALTATLDEIDAVVKTGKLIEVNYGDQDI